MASLHHLALSSSRGQSCPRHASPMPTPPQKTVVVHVSKCSASRRRAADDDDGLDPRGDRAGVGVQDGMGPHRHVKDHAVDRDRRPEDDCVSRYWSRKFAR